MEVDMEVNNVTQSDHTESSEEEETEAVEEKIAEVLKPSKKREKLRNKRRTKKRRTETEEEKLERLRMAYAVRHVSETEIGKLLGLDRCSTTKLIRLAKETEEEKSLRLKRSDKLRRDRQIAKEKQQEGALRQPEVLTKLISLEVKEDQQLHMDVNIRWQVEISSRKQSPKKVT